MEEDARSWTGTMNAAIAADAAEASTRACSYATARANCLESNGYTPLALWYSGCLKDVRSPIGGAHHEHLRMGQSRVWTSRRQCGSHCSSGRLSHQTQQRIHRPVPAVEPACESCRAHASYTSPYAGSTDLHSFGLLLGSRDDCLA